MPEYLRAEFVQESASWTGLSPVGPPELGSVRWEGYTHRHMWNMIMDAQPDDVFDRYDRWTALGEGLIGVNTTVQRQLNSLFSTWQGTAAMSAGMANTRLLQSSQEAAETTQRVGESLGTYGNALVQARKTMPQPRALDAEQDFRSGDGATGLTGPENAYLWLQLQSDHLATAKERAEAREGAIAVMRAFESESHNVDREVAALPPYSGMIAPSVDHAHVNDPGTTGPGPFEGGVVIPPDGVYTDPAGVGPAGVGPGGPGGPGGGSGGPGGPGSGPGSGPGGPGHGVPGGPGGYGPGGYGPGAGRFGAGGPGGPGAGGRFGAGGYGAGGAAGASEAARGAAAGRGPGYGALPGSAAAAEAAAARGAGGAGAAGRGMGAGGMYPPMGGMAHGDDDTEKRVAPYLVDGDDLFDDDRTVAPPVFGA